MHLCRGREKVLRKVRLTVVNSGRVLFPFDLKEEKNLILFQGNTTSNLFGEADSCIHSSYLNRKKSIYCILPFGFMSCLKLMSLVLGKDKQKDTTNPRSKNLHTCSMHSHFIIIQIVQVGYILFCK